ELLLSAEMAHIATASIDRERAPGMAGLLNGCSKTPAEPLHHARIADHVTDFVHRLAGRLADEVGQMLGDTVRVYPVRNWINTVKRTERMLREAGLPANAVPPRLLLRLSKVAQLKTTRQFRNFGRQRVRCSWWTLSYRYLIPLVLSRRS